MLHTRMLTKVLAPTLFAAALALSSTALATTYSSIVLGQGNTNSGQNALQVIALGTDGHAYLPVWQDNNGNWTQTGILPGQGTTLYSQLAAARASGSALGKLQVFGLGQSDGQAYVVAYQDNNGNWYAGGKLPQSGAAYTQLVAAAGTCSSHPLQVFGLGASDGLAHLVAFQDTNGNWSSSNLVLGSQPYSSISIGYGNGGNLQVFGVGESDHLPHLAGFQNDGGTTGQCDWGTPGMMPAPSPAALQVVQVNGNHGNLQVLGLAMANEQPYVEYWQDSSGNWYAGGSIPTPGTAVSAMAAAQGNGGNLQLWGIGASDELGHMLAFQNQSGTWSSVGTVPTYSAAITSIALGNGNGGNVQVIGLGINSHIELVAWQNNSSGTWYSGNDLTPSSGGGGGGVGGGGGCCGRICC